MRCTSDNQRKGPSSVPTPRWLGAPPHALPTWRAFLGCHYVRVLSHQAGTSSVKWKTESTAGGRPLLLGGKEEAGKKARAVTASQLLPSYACSLCSSHGDNEPHTVCVRGAEQRPWYMWQKMLWKHYRRKKAKWGWKKVQLDRCEHPPGNANCSIRILLL